MKQTYKLYNYKYSFILPWILSNLNVEISDTSSQLLQFSYGVFLSSIVALFCLWNIIGYFIASFLLERIDYKTKFPKLVKYINGFKNISLFYICIDLIICLSCLLLLVFYSLVIISQIQPTL